MRDGSSQTALDVTNLFTVTHEKKAALHQVYNPEKNP